MPTGNGKGKRRARLAAQARRTAMQTRQEQNSGERRDSEETLADALGIKARETGLKRRQREGYYIGRFLFRGKPIMRQLRQEFPWVESQHPDGHLVVPLSKHPASPNKAHSQQSSHNVLDRLKRRQPTFTEHAEGLSFGQVEHGQLRSGIHIVTVPLGVPESASEVAWSAQLTKDIETMHKHMPGLGVDEVPKAIVIGTAPDEGLAVQAAQFLNEGGFFAGEFSLTGAQVCPVPLVDATQRM